MNELAGQQKRKSLLQMLESGLVMLHLDPRDDSVIVPQRFKGDPVLRLNIAYGFNLPALDVSREGVYAVLSFSRQNFGCTLPWDAIFAMTSPDSAHEGVVWPESAPDELAPFFNEAGVTAGGTPVSLRPTGVEVVQPDAPDTEATPARQPFVVLDGGAGEGDDGDSTPGTPGAPSKRPQLTVVKGNG